MSTTARISTAERLGRAFGRGWRGYVRGERRVLAWLVDKGAPVVVAATLVWVVKLSVLAALIYVAFWMALLLMFAVAAAWTAEYSNSQEEEEDFMNRKAEERDHRESLGYDPINYYDDPDPRFEDA